MEIRLFTSPEQVDVGLLGELALLVKEAWRRVYLNVGSYTDAYEQDETIWGAPMILAELQKGSRWLVGFEDNRPIAAVALDTLEQAVQVRTLVVHPEARGRGLANLLLDHVADLAREEGAVHLTLFTSGLLEGLVRFYQNIGFIETRREPVERFGLRYDRVFFEKSLLS